MISLRSITRPVGKFVTDNSPAILTGLGVAGTLITTGLAGKAAFTACDIIRKEENMRTTLGEPLTAKEKFGLTWTLYIAPAVTLTTTVGCIVMAQRINTNRAAAIAAAYGLLSDDFETYREKAAEKLGIKKEQTLRDEINQDRVNERPNAGQVIIINDQEQLFYDKASDRYFKSTMEDVKKAQNDMNYQLLNEGYGSANEFYSKVGLGYTPMFEELGWNSDRQLELRFSTTVSDDGVPCHAIEFDVMPIRGFYKTH